MAMVRQTTNLKWNMRTMLRIMSVAILVAGLASAGVIYWSAANSPDESGYEIIGGFVYPGGGEYNKKYIHDLQLYGGNAAMLSDQFMRWFNGLWHGTQLAYTIAIIAIVLSFVVFVVANNISLQVQSDLPGSDADASSNPHSSVSNNR